MFIEAWMTSCKIYKTNKFSIDEAPYEEKYVEEGEAFEDVREAWLEVHLLLGEDKHTQNVS